MTVILVTQDLGVRGPQIAASIAAELDLDLVSQEQLGQLVAARMHIKVEALRRLIEAPPPLFMRWLGERRRLALHTTDEIARLAQQGDVVIESWKAMASVPGVAHGIRVHIGGRRGGASAGAGSPCCQAAISALDAAPARRWGLEPAQPVSIVCDLVLPPAPQALDNCLRQLRQMALGLPWQGPEGSEASLPATSWSRARGAGSLKVEIGSEQMSLHGLTSPDEVIARIEEHLQGRRKPPRRPPLPKDML